MVIIEQDLSLTDARLLYELHSLRKDFIKNAKWMNDHLLHFRDETNFSLLKFSLDEIARVQYFGIKIAQKIREICPQQNIQANFQQFLDSIPVDLNEEIFDEFDGLRRATNEKDARIEELERAIQSMQFDLTMANDEKEFFLAKLVQVQGVLRKVQQTLQTEEDAEVSRALITTFLDIEMNSNEYRCEVCNKPFNNMLSRDNHQKISHKYDDVVPPFPSQYKKD